jgi:protein DGCR14
MAPPQAPHQQRKVLSEEEYTSTLSAIVQRDYFPELPELERHAAILERRAQGDVAGAVALRRAVRRLREHEEALAAEAEEGEHDLDQNVRRRARPLDQESLSGFHSRVTNEDDQEFDSNQKRQIRENRERLDKLLRPSRGPNLPLLMSEMASDQFEATPNRIAGSEWNAPSVRNGLFFNPTPLRNGHTGGLEPGAVQCITNGDKSGASSSSQLVLMPPPANVPKQVAKHQLVEYVPKHALEKRIEPSQTRFPNKIIPFPINTGQGLVHTPDSWETETDGSMTDASTDLDAPLRPLHEERRLERQRRERNQHSYVAMTPLITPGVSGNESPITTWGTVDGTPLVISGKEQPDRDEFRQGAEYGLAKESGRDKAARKAADKLACRAKRAKSANASSSYKGVASLPRFNTTPSLTPSALSLFQKTTQNASSRSGDAFASSLRSSYTPTVSAGSSISSSIRSQSLGSKIRTKDTAFNLTPLATRK